MDEDQSSGGSGSSAAVSRGYDCYGGSGCNRGSSILSLSDLSCASSGQDVGGASVEPTSPEAWTPDTVAESGELCAFLSGDVLPILIVENIM